MEKAKKIYKESINIWDSSDILIDSILMLKRVRTIYNKLGSSMLPHN